MDQNLLVPYLGCSFLLYTVKCVLHKFPFLESSETSKIIPKSKFLFILNSYHITYFYLYYTNLLFIYIYIILHNIISIFIIYILRKFEILNFDFESLNFRNV